MGPLFDQELARRYDAWFMSPMGRHVEQVENQLILDLLKPRAGESLLDVGCGTGNHLLLFRQLGLDVCGVDPSEPMLQIAGPKLGGAVELKVASAEELPYEDNSFDIVTLISSMEFAQPLHALSEAARVARSRVFVGVLNSFSANGFQRSMEALLKPTIYRHAKFYNIWELRSLVHRVVGTCRVQWGSVLWLPLRFYSLDRRLSRWMPRMRNPLGAFLGMRIELGYTYRALLDPISTGWAGPGKADPSCCPLHRDLSPTSGLIHSAGLSIEEAKPSSSGMLRTTPLKGGAGETRGNHSRLWPGFKSACNHVLYPARLLPVNSAAARAMSPGGAR